MIDIKESTKIKATLEKGGGIWADLPLLLPAATVLELAGEGLRPRLYFANSPDGEELCLRADLTIPAALTFIDSGDDAAIYLCSGKVFRAQQSAWSNPEFRQIGLERYGDSDKQKADFETFSSIYETCKTIGLNNGKVVLSDGGLFGKILKGANIPSVWRDYLLPQVNNINELNRRIKIATEENSEKAGAIEHALLSIENDEDAANLVNEILEISKLKQGLVRTTSDIAKRLRQKAQRQVSSALDLEIAETLNAILQLIGVPSEVFADVVTLGKKIGIDLADWAINWNSQIEQIRNLVGDDVEIIFNVGMPKRFEYYDGIRFEIYTDGQTTALATGGRYDGLISELTKGEKNTPAVGAVIRPEVILGGQ